MYSYQSLLQQAYEILNKEQPYLPGDYLSRDIHANNMVIREALAKRQELLHEEKNVGAELAFSGGMTERGVLKREARARELGEEIKALCFISEQATTAVANSARRRANLDDLTD